MIWPNYININLRWLLLTFLVLSLNSCKKEFDYPSNDYGIKPVDEKFIDNGRYITLWGKFLLIDAVMFVENKETNEKKMFHHFGPTKNTSSLRWGGSIFEIETIIKDSTNFSFYKPKSIPGYGNFILNNDTSKHYAVYFTNNHKSIVEDPIYGVKQQLLGGSAKPFSGQILNYDEKTVVIQIHEAYASINGYNCRYWNQLTMKKIEEWN